MWYDDSVSMYRFLYVSLNEILQEPMWIIRYNSLTKN